MFPKTDNEIDHWATECFNCWIKNPGADGNGGCYYFKVVFCALGAFTESH